MGSTVLTVEAAKQANINVIENARGTQAVHEAVVALQANRRSGTASTKTKGEVAYSGKKPWRQKGTGRARAGYRSSPIWVGGGVAFGPKPRDYSKKVPKKVRRLAFLKALSSRILAGDVLITDDVVVPVPKTKEFLALLRSHTDAEKVLLLSTRFDENTRRAARNIKPILLQTAAEVNTEHLLRYQKIIVTNEALAKLAERVS
ncbi:MAG: 50S ribosomal protein L4 [Verrucomicrobia bacterium]|nr:50S ribosomal protein L4 [Verrucomicrobiota bacterium]